MIEIPGRLHSKATDHVVTGANEIFDDVQNKKQSVINAENESFKDAQTELNEAQSEFNSEVREALGTGGTVDERIANAVNTEKDRAEGAEEALDGRVETLEEAVGTGGSVDERIAEAVENAAFLGANDGSETIADFDPQADSLWKGAQILSSAEKAQVKTNLGLPQEIYSKTEVNNLITTPNQQYITVATYSSLPASGSADTIYRVSNYNGSTSQVDSTMYSEYAWNGTAYEFLCVKSQVGEVFDISAYNSNTKYADLAAALGTNGANVPEGLRKGGMSVKFVSNSDNKYVQFRYMSDDATTTATFTNVANWQGVDKLPTLGSQNVVESGGVFVLQGCYAHELTVNTVGASSRVGKHFPIDDPTKTFVIKVTNDAETVKGIRIAILKGEGYTSGYRLETIYAGSDKNVDLTFNISLANQPSAKYIGVYCEIANVEYSFTVNELYIKDSIYGEQKQIDALGESIDNIEHNILCIDKHLNYKDLSLYTLVTGSINLTVSSENFLKWQNTDQRIKHIVIPVSEFDRTKPLHVTASEVETRLCFLSAYNVSFGQDASVISVHRIKSNTSASLQIPQTAQYVYLLATDTQQSTLPSEVCQDDVVTLFREIDEINGKIPSEASTSNKLVTENEVDQIRIDISNLENGEGGNDSLYERKAIQSITPYYLQSDTEATSYSDGFYLEQKVRKVQENPQGFIFITDTHLPRSARHSDLLLSYIKKRCNINLGIFGGDCIDWNNTKYIAANVLTDYASEFFSIFDKQGLWTQGNHDNNSNAYTAHGIDKSTCLITDIEAYDRTVKNIESSVVFDTLGLTVLESIISASNFEKCKWWMKMHYYKDDIITKTRYIILESGDNSLASNYFKDYDGVKWFQIDFVASCLQTIPDGYNAVICCHECGKLSSKVPYWINPDIQLMKMLSTYKGKGSITIDPSTSGSGTSGDAYDVNKRCQDFWKGMNVAKGGTSVDERSFDFSESVGNGKVFLLTGHFHNDVTFAGQTKDGVYSISRVCEHDIADIDAYSNAETYSIGDEVVYSGEIYACKTDISTPEEFDSDKWIPLLDKDSLEDDSVYLLWRNRDAYNAVYQVVGVATGYTNHMILNTMTEQSFDVISITDTSIKIVKIGAGEDVELLF